MLECEENTLLVYSYSYSYHAYTYFWTKNFLFEKILVREHKLVPGYASPRNESAFMKKIHPCDSIISSLGDQLHLVNCISFNSTALYPLSSSKDQVGYNITNNTQDLHLDIWQLYLSSYWNICAKKKNIVFTDSMISLQRKGTL